MSWQKCRSGSSPPTTAARPSARRDRPGDPRRRPHLAYLTTTAAELNTKGLTGNQRVEFENEVRAACEELASMANVNPINPTAAEFVSAVENGLEYLQAVYGSDDE